MEHRTSAELKGFAAVIRPQRALEEGAPREVGSGTRKPKGYPPAHPERDRIQTGEGTVGFTGRELPADCSLRGPSVAIGRSDER